MTWPCLHPKPGSWASGRAAHRREHQRALCCCLVHRSHLLQSMGWMEIKAIQKTEGEEAWDATNSGLSISLQGGQVLGNFGVHRPFPSRATLQLRRLGVLVTWSLSKPGRNSKASTVLGLHFFEGLISLFSLPTSLERCLLGLLPSLIVDDIWEHIAKVCYSWKSCEGDISSNVSGLSAQSCAALGPVSESELYFSWRPFRMRGWICWKYPRVVTCAPWEEMAF